MATAPTEHRSPSLIQGSWSFRVTVEPGPEPGTYVATCVEHPELSATGTTADAAVDSVADLLVRLLVDRGELAEAAVSDM